MSRARETIVAVATPPGRGGIGILRVSGPAAAAIAQAVLGVCPPPRHALYKPFLDADGQALDEGIGLYFPAPHSFTGEDVLELQGHGGPVVLDLLFRRIMSLGARSARPGEFSERAFLNNKLDLAQAEAIADLIDSDSEQAARSALRSLQGAFSERVHALTRALIELRTYVEAALDFPDEDIDFLAERHVAERLQQLRDTLAETRAQARQGALLREGMRLVILGRPNAGKSTLLNALAGKDSAIVTEVPGTTRDVLREQIDLDGLPLHLVDTAGLRESEDPIEQEGMRRAWGEIETADAVVLLVDGEQGAGPEEQAILARLPARLPVLTVHNKIDLTGHACGEVQDELFISAKTGSGLNALKTSLKALMRFQGEQGVFIARRRHLEALERAASHIEEAARQLSEYQAGELMAEELRLAQEALGGITGTFSSDDLLGEIFSSFCIGK